MASLVIHQGKLTPAMAETLAALCPFAAIEYQGGELSINAGCKMCRVCVKKGPAGAITLAEDADTAAVDKDAWRGIAVYAQLDGPHVHNVARELLGKARELAAVTGHPVHALCLGHNTGAAARELLRCGADKVFVYDHPQLADFKMLPYAAAFADYIEKIRPSVVMVGATVAGRALAPRVAARFKTGLTADCTVLQMKENTDLVQIRPAFGGNVMAQIVTPNHRPQFCTVRYKVFCAPAPVQNPAGEIVPMAMDEALLATPEVMVAAEEKPREIDISEARVVVAVGRGVKTRQELDAAQRLANLLGGQMACTRPLIENGWFDPRRQIGLSGRTVCADLIVTLGISGSVQFAAGMKGSACIMAVNSDPDAPIFNIAHYAVEGDVSAILPQLLNQCREVQARGA